MDLQVFFLLLSPLVCESPRPPYFFSLRDFSLSLHVSPSPPPPLCHPPCFVFWPTVPASWFDGSAWWPMHFIPSPAFPFRKLDFLLICRRRSEQRPRYGPADSAVYKIFKMLLLAYPFSRMDKLFSSATRSPLLFTRSLRLFPALRKVTNWTVCPPYPERFLVSPDLLDKPWSRQDFSRIVGLPFSCNAKSDSP